jgi:predicted PolB exonuclease-like 3'-5' exonuclease
MANHSPTDFDHLMVIDIETVPQYQSFEQMPDDWKALWADRVSKTMPEKSLPAEMYEQRAGIHAEFGKIICISTGHFFTTKEKLLCFEVQSFYQKDEKKLLLEFFRSLAAFYKKRKNLYFLGHNIKEFDIPYISRRSMIHQLPLPDYLDFSGKKPWETNLLDTMQLWKFGDYKTYTSLKLLTACLGIDTPKDDIDGSQVKDVYYKEKNIRRIAQYCRKDVVAAAQIYLRFLNQSLIPSQQIFGVE